MKKKTTFFFIPIIEEKLITIWLGLMASQQTIYWFFMSFLLSCF